MSNTVEFIKQIQTRTEQYSMHL